MAHAMKTRPHPLANIAEQGAKPIAKESALRTGAHIDDRTTGFLLAQEVYTNVIREAQSYADYARRVMELTMEARTAFVAALKDIHKTGKEANKLNGAVDARVATKRWNSAVVNLTNLQRVADAWNAGATEAGLLKYANDKVGKANKMTIEDVGFNIIKEYSKQFLKSQGQRAGAGRTIKPGIEKLAKYIADLTADPKMQEFWAEHAEDKAAVDKVAGVVAKLAPKTEEKGN